MVFEKLADGFDKDIFRQTLLQNLLDLRLAFGFQYGSLLLEQQAHAIQRHDFQRAHAYNPVQKQVKLLHADVADETVENPRENDAQRLNLELFEFYH